MRSISKVSLFTLFFSHIALSFAEEEALVFTLDTIEVTADPIEETSTSATRIELPILDTPHSIDVIDEEVIDEQQANTIDEILKNDASISNRGNHGSLSSFGSRGFTLNEYGNYLRNGLLYYYFDVPPVESIDRVEILKGPASFLYGSGSPGGMINFVSKKPTMEDFLDGGVQTGSYDYYRAYADLNQMIFDDTAYRLNLALEDTHSFRDHYYRTRELVDFSVGTDTMLNVMFQHTDTPQDTGLVAIGNSVADLPRNAYLNQDWTKTELTSLNVNLDDHREILNDWTLHSALYYQYIDRERILSSLRLSENSTGDFQYSMQHQFDTWNAYSILTEMMSEKDWLLNQKLLFGINYNLLSHDILTTTPIISDTYHIDDIPTLEEPDFGPYQSIDILTNNVGVYAQDVIELHEQWDLTLGARFDYYTSDSSDLSNSNANHTSPHAALVYKPYDIWSVYTSYTEGFQFNEPVSEINAINYGEALDPTLSEQIEVGSKIELFDNRLLLSAALFDILRYNSPITEDIEDSPNEVIVVQTGEQRHQGLELGAQGHISPQWTTHGSLMWLDARFSEDNENEIAGNRPAAVPALSATAWTEYRFIHHFAINGGVFYEGKRYGDNENTFVLDPYARVDVGTAYYYPMEEEKEFIIRLNVENISDLTYYTGHRRTNVTVGAPRSVWLTFEIER